MRVSCYFASVIECVASALRSIEGHQGTVDRNELLRQGIAARPVSTSIHMHAICYWTLYNFSITQNLPKIEEKQKRFLPLVFNIL